MRRSQKTEKNRKKYQSVVQGKNHHKKVNLKDSKIPNKYNNLIILNDDEWRGAQWTKFEINVQNVKNS